MKHDIDESFGDEAVSPEERQQRIRDLFNRVARRYDLMNDMMSFGIHRAWKRSFVRDLPDSGLFVDLAGGTGDVAVLAAKQPARQVVVCDPSIEMMEVGRDRHAEAPLAWVAGEGEHLPFPTGSVSALTVAFGLRNVTHLRRALAEAHRVLKPNGIFACLEFSRPLAGFRPFYDAYSYWVIPRLGAWVAAEPAAYQYLVESIRRFPDQEAFARLLREAGFKDVSYRNVSLGIACIHRARR
ncbi:MAG: class I SAM-dependent methyltransferase [Xanthomonadales bacterium]|nr:class I SAM-dependent methyltransferase [Xanthomonadales bacterium]